MINEYTGDSLSDYLHEIGQFPLLSFDEEQELLARIQQGDKNAYNRFVHCNLKLVVMLAKRYRREGVTLMELISVGNEGLLHAVEKFDCAKGRKFSTYATWWIRQGMQRLLRQRGLIWRPEYVMIQIEQLHRAEAQLGENATDEEIATLAKLPVEHLAELRGWNMEVHSLETILNEQSGNDPLYLESMLEDKTQTTKAQRSSEHSELKGIVNEALKALTPRQREIIRLRYGLDDDDDRSLDRIGKQYRISRERVRQIEQVAFEKLQPLLQEVAQRWGAAV